jgi:molybdopterin-containing oxidoreductase family iron-sulfur binding subunit
VVVPGIEQPPIVHALAHAINRLLENFGATVTFSDLVAAPLADGTASQLESLRALNDAMAAGQVNTLIMVGSNPAYSAPADFNFAANLANVGLSIHMNEYLDETGALCTWHVPQAHFLESWGDARAYDGTVSIIQPLIAPLYDGKTALELFSVLNGTPDTSYNIVRTYWQNQTGGGDFATFWNTVLRDGVIAGTALGAKTVSLGLQNIPAPAELSMATELTFRPDSAVWDGRFSNNAWLQELPRPWTRIAWDNAALVSPRLAIELFGLPVADINNLTPQDYEALSEANGNMVELQYNGRTLQVPIWVTPGQPYRSITLHLGYGHDGLGNVADGVGFNAYALRGSEAPWFGRVAVTPVGGKYQVVSTQDHHSMEGRAIIRAGTLQQYLENPGFIGVLPEFPNHPERSQFQDLFPYEDGYSWGMVIDLNTCIACNSCVVACQAENNIPTVGKDQVAIGREMHWIRIDRYYGGSLDEPMLYQQPMACVHCELAPCEIVCPVNATVHDHEGLNVMIYNRCVGTRYCSNNCPYKVRRFNFLQYMDEETPSLSLQRNPDVTVRSRGVMEKCTYCVQRIKEATIPAKNANRPVADGEITPACAQACPTHAITFGDLNDHESRVYKLKQNLLNYGVLEQFNFFPRTTYLGRITNPNPAIGQREGADYPGHGYPYGQDAHGGESDHGEGEMHTEGGESPESGH